MVLKALKIPRHRNGMVRTHRPDGGLNRMLIFGERHRRLILAE
jgi:hypothetical protein